MSALIHKGLSQLTQLREILFMLYFIGTLVLAFVLLMEVKIYFAVDMFPGVDIPLDEWYASAFK